MKKIIVSVFALALLLSALALSVCATTEVDIEPPQNVSASKFYDESTGVVSSIKITYTNSESFDDLITSRFENGNYVFSYKIVGRYRVDDNDWYEFSSGDFTFASGQKVLSSISVLHADDQSLSPDLKELVKTDNGVTFLYLSTHKIDIQIKYVICALTDGFTFESEYSSVSVISDEDSGRSEFDKTQKPEITSGRIRYQADSGYYLTIEMKHPDPILKLMTLIYNGLWYNVEVKTDGDWQSVQRGLVADLKIDEPLSAFLTKDEISENTDYYVRVCYEIYSKDGDTLFLSENGEYSDVFTVSFMPTPVSSDVASSDMPNTSSDKADGKKDFMSIFTKEIIIVTSAVVLLLIASLVLAIIYKKSKKKQ